MLPGRRHLRSPAFPGGYIATATVTDAKKAQKFRNLPESLAQWYKKRGVAQKHGGEVGALPRTPFRGLLRKPPENPQKLLELGDFYQRGTFVGVSVGE